MANGLTKLHCANNEILATRSYVASRIIRNAENLENGADNNAKYLKLVDSMT